MDYKDIEQAEKVLTKLTDTFRAVQYLNDVLATLKPVIGGIAQYEAQLASKAAELAVLKGAVDKARQDLAEARIEKEKVEAAVAAVKAQLRDLKL